MDFIAMIKNLIGMGGDNSSSSDWVVGGVDLDAMDRQNAVREVTAIIDVLEVDDLKNDLEGKHWQSARETLDDVIISNYKDALNDLNEVDPEYFEAVNNDMSLVEAGKKYIKDMLVALKPLHKMIDAGEAGNDEEYKKIQSEFDEKSKEITDTWNNALVAFTEKHNIPFESQF